MDIYDIEDPKQLRQAGLADLVRMKPAPRAPLPLFIQKGLLERLTYAIVFGESVHLSGPTGSAKSSVIEAISEPANFGAMCRLLRLPVKPVKLYPVEMVIFEAPGELYARRALIDGRTYDEKSDLVRQMEDAEQHAGRSYPLIWLREMGRVHSASVQGGLLNLIVRGEIRLPDGSAIDGSRIAWVADSNYQAANDGIYILVTFDTALQRRFSLNLTLDYLTQAQEAEVLRDIVDRDPSLQGTDPELIEKVVRLGGAIRKAKEEGSVSSVPPPTLYGYVNFLRMARVLAHHSLQDIAQATLLGNASREDRREIPRLLQQVLGLPLTEEVAGVDAYAY
jgi:MoxR-like ATPase